MAWAEERPLFGQRVLVTRNREQADEFVRAIEQLGGEPYEYPVIEMRLPTSPAQRQAIQQAFKQAEKYSWLVFTSVNGIKYWFRYLQEQGQDIRRWANARMVTVGPKTAEALQEYGVQPDVTTSQFSQEGVWEALRTLLTPGERVLLARGDLSRPWLKEMVSQYGLGVDEIDLYETVLPAEDDPHLLELLEENAIHLVTFTSSSTVTNLVAVLRRMGVSNPAAMLNSAQVVCIGEITAHTARKAGLRVDAIAERSTIGGMVEAMRKLCSEKTDKHM